MPKEAKLYKTVEVDGRRFVVCTACPRRCTLRDGQAGFCGVRININDKLYLAVYGLAIAVAIDPIEKKPLYHFNPGSMVFSIATTGCNWGCRFCQNYDISQRRIIAGWKLDPELVVKLATSYGAHGITYTYNEPTIFIEYAYDIGMLAKKEGLFNTMVTNGYMTDEAIDLVAKFVDAVTVDFKGNADPEFARKFSLVPNIEEVFRALQELKRKGVFIEITDLVVPRYGDDLEKARKLVKWIIENLGPETPLHFLRFHPEYLMYDVPPTPVEVLEKHVNMAKEEGMHYVYIGNVPGHKFEHTYCPNCGYRVIKRYGFEILEWNLTEDMRCIHCGKKVNIVGKLFRTYKLDRFVYVPLEAYSDFVYVPQDKVREFILQNT